MSKTWLSGRRERSSGELSARPRDNSIGTFAELIAIDQDDVTLKPAPTGRRHAAGARR
ncbi:MAG TPA: hypothetical protein VMK84_15805 [Streptosporangiaceae bacterium]|nr:hypothetical protein [Streptosporangiaceae bacterium]